MTERQAKERVLRLGMLEYAVLAPATLVAAAFLLAEKGERIDPSMTLPWVIGVLVGAALMPHPSGSLQARSWRYPAWYLG